MERMRPIPPTPLQRRSGRPRGSSADSGTISAADADWEPPRTPWGDPDLQGTWPINHLTGVPLQRDPALGERRYLNEEEMQVRVEQYGERSERLGNEVEGNQLGMGHWVEWGQLNNIASLIVDPPNGRLPALTAEGERRRALMKSGWMEEGPFDHYEDFDNWDRCITRSLPASMLPSYYNAGIRILQSPGWVAIRLEMIHEVRLVRLEGLARLLDGALGGRHARGRYDQLQRPRQLDEYPHDRLAAFQQHADQHRVRARRAFHADRARYDHLPGDGP